MYPCNAKLIGQLDSSLKRLQFLRMARLRNGATNNGIGRVFFYRSCRFSRLRIAQKCAAWRIRCVLVYMGEFEGLAVGPIRMSVKPVQVHGPIRNDLIEILLVWHAGGSEHRVIPAAPQKPWLIRMRGGIGLNPLLDFLNRLSSVQKNLLQQQRTFHEVNVTVR